MDSEDLHGLAVDEEHAPMAVIARPLRNQHGGVIGIILILLALIGAWYMYQSYTRGQVKSNLKSITNDYEHGIKKIIPSGKETRP